MYKKNRTTASSHMVTSLLNWLFNSSYDERCPSSPVPRLPTVSVKLQQLQCLLVSAVCFMLQSSVVSVAVNQGDEEEEGTEGDGTGEHSFYKQSRPATQQKDMDKQSAKREKENYCTMHYQ